MAQQKGRPITRPPKLKDGFYIELSNIGSGSRVKVRKENIEQVEIETKKYAGVKVVTFLGELKAGKWLSGKNKGKKLPK